MFSLDSMCLETLMSTKECDEIKVARRRMAGKMTRLQGADGYEMSSMRTYSVLPSWTHSHF